MNTYGRLPVAFSHGEGSWLIDTEGKRYLDALSGIAVNTLGHNHPKLVSAIAAQAAKVLHTSNIYRIPQAEQLSDRLAALSGMLFIIGELAYKSKAGKYGTVVLFFVLSFGMLGFVAKLIFEKVAGI